MPRFEKWSPELIAALAEPFPAAWMQTKKKGGTSIPFAPWWRYAERLTDLVGEGWGTGTPLMHNTGEKLVLAVPVTILGRTQCNVGDEDSDEDGYGSASTNAFSQAFRRSCALHGLGAYLYDKAKRERGSRPVEPQRSVASASGVRRDSPGVDTGTGEVKEPRPETEMERLARNLRKLAADVDGERQRTGEHLSAPSAVAEAEDVLQDPDCTPATMKRLGAPLLAELTALKQAPTASEAPTYENFQAPTLAGDDDLPFV